MIILIIIILLFIILSIIWYLVVRDVDVETFPENDNQMVLKFGHKYLQAGPNKSLVLGHNRRLATFLVVDSRDYRDCVQFESVEYPGYLICYHQGRWRLQSQYYVSHSRKTVFIPLGIKRQKKRLGFVNLHNRYCIAVKGPRVIAQEYHSYPKKNQLFTFVRL